MKRIIGISTEDLETSEQNALELFYSGIKSKETRRIFKRNLKVFLTDVCVDLFKGDLQNGAQQFMNLVRKD
jgi:hypothetical protein